jgi:NADPH-dependent ferric siderophore reductase
MPLQLVSDPAAVYEAPAAHPEDQIQWLLQRLGMTPAEAARDLEVPAEEMYAWCTGTTSPPRIVILALRHLADRLRWID